jgi:uncharacterized protein (UPF0147 family)
MVEINDVVDLLIEIIEDSTTPKNVKEKMNKIMDILKNGDEDSIKINKALNELDDVASDSNMQQFTRTQIWNVVSLLEKF